MNRWLGIREAQAISAVDRTTLYRNIRSGRLPAVREGRGWRLDAEHFMAWLNQRARRRSGGRLSAHLAAPPLQRALPVTCAQAVQDVVAESLDVTLITTDLNGQPMTQFSNPRAFLAMLLQHPQVLAAYMHTWQALANAPALEPVWHEGADGLLCARGLIRYGSALLGMVIALEVAPAGWPPKEARQRELAQALGVPVDVFLAAAHDVHYLSDAQRTRVLHAVQRLADAFSHMVLVNAANQQRRPSSAAHTPNAQAKQE
ncbi:MAG: helix-turn-helix domain-containing protein [Thermoflexales bacterium]|nr:helix-turn-helix domain-containing protein [Thermoflexales bacterium]